MDYLEIKRLYNNTKALAEKKRAHGDERKYRELMKIAGRYKKEADKRK